MTNNQLKEKIMDEVDNAMAEVLPDGVFGLRGESITVVDINQLRREIQRRITLLLDR